MKHALSRSHSLRQATSRAPYRPIAGPDGIAIAPPAYGIDFVDRQASSSQELPIQREVRRGNREPERHQNNRTGLPEHLKAGIESLSGFDLNDVRVHFNSAKPAQLQALAYTQGTDIHVAPGQEQHLPHEAWHVVQQAQGRVQPRFQLKGEQINDDDGLEQEAEVMGREALRMTRSEINAAEIPVKQIRIQAYSSMFNQTDPTSGNLNPRDRIPLGGKPVQLQTKDDGPFQLMYSANTTQHWSDVSIPTTGRRKANTLDQSFNMSEGDAFFRTRGLGCVQRALTNKTNTAKARTSEEFPLNYIKIVTTKAENQEKVGKSEVKRSIPLNELKCESQDKIMEKLRPSEKEQRVFPKPKYEIPTFTVRKAPGPAGHWAMYFEVQRPKKSGKALKVHITGSEYEIISQNITKPFSGFLGIEEHYKIEKPNLTVEQLYAIIADTAKEKGAYTRLGDYDCHCFVEEVIKRLASWSPDGVKLEKKLRYDSIAGESRISEIKSESPS